MIFLDGFRQQLNNEKWRRRRRLRQSRQKGKYFSLSFCFPRGLSTSLATATTCCNSRFDAKVGLALLHELTRLQLSSLLWFSSLVVLWVRDHRPSFTKGDIRGEANIYVRPSRTLVSHTAVANVWSVWKKDLSRLPASFSLSGSFCLALAHSSAHGPFSPILNSQLHERSLWREFTGNCRH